MSASGTDSSASVEGLRERLPNEPALPQQAPSKESAQSAVKSLNAKEEEKGKDDQEKRTYGRTPGGTVFTVPQTHDMVSQLLSPVEPKNASDIVILTVLAWIMSLLFVLPKRLTIPLYAVIFLFWRACYNGGIGYLLQTQSHHKRLVAWAKRSALFENPKSGNNPHPEIYKLLKREMETKIPKDYDFDQAPLEYNTWLLFRRVVDLILMCDFVSYCCFAAACGGRPLGEKLAMTVARWACGIVLVLFNLWVKLDAHRVVKDYAWYWGDFFFLIDQELTFDGVFEMAPHPMYSVGYAGYYGISLMAASYKVLTISIIAHVAQFAFLYFVESPHIEKTYNTPAPRRRPTEDMDAEEAAQARSAIAGHVNGYPPIASTSQPSHIHNLIGPENIDLHRVTDVSALVLQLILYSTAFMSPSNRAWQFYFVLLATLARLWYNLGIGFILDRQSNKKKWTRHFVKYGESTEEAWRQWKGIYHLSMTLCYSTFICAAWKMYHLPHDWTYGMATLRHVVGFALVALQLWTVFSIYESLGEFGWFFGDFFFDQAPKLTYSGIYRFLNNPERVLGLAGLWGAAIITWSKAMFFLALLSHVMTLAFIQFIERPHMQKLYGQTLRRESGISKTFKRSLPGPLKTWQGSVDRALEDTLDFVEDLIDSARPKFANGVDTIVRDTKTLFKHYPARITISRLSPDLAGFDPKDYAIDISSDSPPPSSVRAAAGLQRHSGREGEEAQKPQTPMEEPRTLVCEYGAPIKVKWRAPANHSKMDWIGLYMVADNASRSATRVSSQGRWSAVTKDTWDTSTADTGILVNDHLVTSSTSSPLTTDRSQDVSSQTKREKETGSYCEGEVLFSGDKLWWTQGVFEFRYHHDGKHNVMAVSLPFEIRIGKFDEEDALSAENSGSSLPGAMYAADDAALSRYMSNESARSTASANYGSGAGDAALRAAVEKALLPVVRNCFDRDPDFAPRTVDEKFGEGLEREGRYARRVVFAVHQMFGIEFAPEVVLADGSVKNLAWRIVNAKMVLRPYSMSRPSQGQATPT